MKKLSESEKNKTREVVHKMLTAYRDILCLEIRKIIEEGTDENVNIDIDYGFSVIKHISRQDDEIEIQMQQRYGCFTCYLEDLNTDELHRLWRKLINNEINEDD